MLHMVLFQVMTALQPIDSHWSLGNEPTRDLPPAMLHRRVQSGSMTFRAQYNVASAS